MTEAITSRQLSILQFVSKNPGVTKDMLVSTKGASEVDLHYLLQNDMLREREMGCFRVSHFGEMVLRRSL